MGVLDLPALVHRVLTVTGFQKLGLVCHSQGTTETFVALAKDQRPELGERISVFCALAPAAYAGPLIRKVYFKFMRIISPGGFRVFFGIHSFIPFMMSMHRLLPGAFYGAMGYRVFSFLFNWSDDRWDRELRDRMFQFAPVYVSAESMRWWLGRECFAKQKCILNTKEHLRAEEKEDHEDGVGGIHLTPIRTVHTLDINDSEAKDEATLQKINTSGTMGTLMTMDTLTGTQTRDRGGRAWYDERFPPLAVWVAANDELVDGRKLLKRFARGREPHVKLVHSKVVSPPLHTLAPSR
jgi:hypothetical protein